MDKEQVAKKVRERIERIVLQFDGKNMTPAMMAQLSDHVQKELTAIMFPHASFRLHVGPPHDGRHEVHVTMPKWLSEMLYENTEVA